MLLRNSLYISHDLVAKVLGEGDIAVDATMGNGNDTVFLAKLVGEKGKVYAFDIQKIAVNLTAQRLEKEALLDRVVLIQDGHQNIDKYINEEVRAVMFNLGYLPKGDHCIGTKANTTIEAINKALELLSTGGIVMVVVYYGGDSGFDEKNEVMDYIKTIDCKKYTVLVHDFINQINCPPIAVCIEKNY